MTTPAPPANPCSQCGAGEALFSLMSLGDYSQVKPCGACAIPMFRGLADDMEQAGLAAETAETVAELTDPDGDVAAVTVPAGTDGDGDGQADTAAPAAPARKRKTGTALWTDTRGR